MANRLMALRIKEDERRNPEKPSAFFIAILISVASILIITFFSVTSRAIIQEEFDLRLKSELWKHDEINRRLINLEEKHEELLNKLLLDGI